VAGSGSGSFLKRSWRRFRRRPARIQTISWVTVVVVIGAVVFGITASSSSAKPPSSTNAANGPVNALDTASTSSRGVTATTIRVAFPISDLSALAADYGAAGDIEYSQQTQAIDTFVNAINAAGGIDGRKIVPDIVTFDPTSETDMRSLCKQWTEGNPPVFAVIDGVGTWTGDNELCITQEGHTPMIAEWTTISQWTQEGSPYLWWTGADQTSMLATLVDWGKSAGLLGGSKKVAVVVGDMTSDQDAVDDYLLPDFKAAGLPAPLVVTMPDQTTEQAAISSDAPLVVQRLAAAGIQSVIPLIQFNAFFPYLEAESQQRYYPKLLLSDYDQSIEIGLGLIPIPFEQELNGQEGITAETLGGADENSITIDGKSTPLPESKGGYDPGVQQCYDLWKAHNAPPKNKSPFIEEQGPIVGWCQAIELFAAAAKNAGHDLTRRSFVEGMAAIKNFAGTYSPLLSYGPDKFSGPDEYRVVRIHNNSPSHNECVLTYDGVPQGTCWQIVSNWRPLVSG
jgi:Periplasmic binding protein